MRFYLILLAMTLLAMPAGAQSIPADASAAVILAYYRVGEDEYPASNLRIEQFTEQMQELSNSSYHVMPLKDIVAALATHQPLPPRTIAITFEGGYKSLLKHALPVLQQHNFPFTVFYAGDMAGAESEQYLGWNDLKTLKQNKIADFGLLPANASAMAGQSEKIILESLNRARVQEREKLGLQSTLFSYALGQYDIAYRDLIKAQGFNAAFGLQSGVAYAGADMFTLPRFTMTENYGDLERFRMVVNALPLPVTGLEPENPVLKEPKPLIGFSIDEHLKEKIKSLSCYITGESNPQQEVVGETRIELRLSAPLLEDRNRINCTIPVTGEEGRFRWFGMMLFNTQDAVLDSAEETLEP